MSNKVLFLSHLIPKELYGEVNKNAKGNMQDAANALQWRLLEGFLYHLGEALDVISYLPIASFPGYYRKTSVKKMEFSLNDERKGISIGFNNIKYIRRFSINRNLSRQVMRWCREHKDEGTIIAYTLNPVMLLMLEQVKAKFPNIKTCAIIADLPDMMDLSSNTGIVSRAFKKRVADKVYRRKDCVDRFVFLTKHMSDYMENDKPYCVMEGIAPTNGMSEDYIHHDRVDSLKKILYTGTLHKRFGVLHMLNAFRMTDNPDYRLIICGVGDSKNDIEEAAKEDPRIVFKGKCSHKEVLELQKSATVLVNPRMNIEEFTKYSFPSKNLEYLASGVPLVAYKLDGIPDEYDEYIHYPRDNSVEALKERITEILELPEDQRQQMGETARHFVVDNKNAVVQTRKILVMLDIAV